MTMARAKRRAVSASTDAIAGPSRRCTWKSSGRLSVMRSIAAILLCPLQRLAVELAFRQPGEARRQLRRFAGRERLEQHVEHAFGVQAMRGALLARREHQRELALFPMGMSQPSQSIAERQARDLLELLAELAREDDLALRTEARQQVFERVPDPMRCLVQHQRPGHIERLERFAPGGGLGGEKAGEQE